MRLTKAPKYTEAVEASAGDEELIKKRASDELLGSTNDLSLLYGL